MILKNLFLIVSATVFLFIGISSMLMSQTDELKLEKVTDDLYMISGGGGNVTFMVTAEGVLVVDAMSFPYQGEQLVAMIKKITNANIKYLVFTHYHDDHILGAQSFPPETQVIAHAYTRKNIESLTKSRIEKDLKEYFPQAIKDANNKIEKLKKEGSSDVIKAEEERDLIMKRQNDLEKIKIAIPQITVDKEMTIKLGGRTVKLIHPGIGHTNGDLVVYFPDEKVIAVGDLVFNNIIPYIDRDGGADTENWMWMLRKLAKLDIEKVIPGHGEIGNKKILTDQAQYFLYVHDEVRKLLREKLTVKDIVTKLNMIEYKDMKGYDQRFSQNVEAIAREMGGK